MKVVGNIATDEVRSVVVGFVEGSDPLCFKEVSSSEVVSLFDFTLGSRFSPAEEEAIFCVDFHLVSRSSLDFSLDSRFSPMEIRDLFCIDPLLSLLRALYLT